MKFLMTYAPKPGSPSPSQDAMARIAKFTQECINKGIVLMTGGLVRPTHRIRLVCEGGRSRVVDGAFGEMKELVDGFALIQAESREDAIRIAGDFMAVAGDGTSEILQVFDPGPQL
jgi:hypothetical protein